jgi:hypothetical protein
MGSRSDNSPALYKAILPHEIRLLKLSPSILERRIHCSLETVTLSNSLQYEALSYCWGQPNDTENILLDRQPFAITKNLYAALLAFRHPYKSRLLWVDALCISQQDLVERSQQVQVMGEIYCNAERVLIWLGEAQADDDNAIQRISALPRNLSSEVVLAISKDNHVINLFKRPWWTRTWIVQEVALSKTAIIVCGSAMVEWEKVAALVEELFQHPKVEIDVYKAVFRPFQLCQHREFLPRPILSAIVSLQRQDASDPRDKIYGYLGIMSEADRRLIIPDYHLTVKEVYEQAVRSIIQAASNLNILSLVDVNRQSDDFPSWLYDLRESNPDHAYIVDPVTKSYNTSGNSKPCMGILGASPDILDLDGFVWDTITHLGTYYDEIDAAANPNPYVCLINDWTRALGRNGQNMQEQYIAGGTVENAFWSTLLIDQWQDPQSQAFRRADPEDKNFFRAMCSMMLNLAGETQPTVAADRLIAKRTLDQNRDYYSNLFSRKLSRLTTWRLLITSRGYVGLCCNAAAIGDRVCVLLGGEVPFLLRPRVCHDGQREGIDCSYHFMGECYIHGIMDGEAMKELYKKDGNGIDTQTFHLH